MQQRIVPIPIPVLKKNPIKLKIHTRIRRAQVNRHIPGRGRMDEKLMYRARLDGNLAIVTRDRPPLAVNLNAQQACLDLEVFRLELVEVQKWAFRSVGAVEKFAKVGRNGAGEVVLVGLAEEEASSWRGLEVLGCQQAAETVKT